MALSANTRARGISGFGRGGILMEDLATANFSAEIQDAANSYFEKIYAHENNMTVAEFLEKLRSFSNSVDQKERLVLRCIAKILFMEYEFFDEYPERELKITAEIYGGIIREKIISEFGFASASRRIIESLQSGPGSMSWLFGIVALDACRMRLCSWPKVCHIILQSNNFRKLPKSIQLYVNCGLYGQLPPNDSRTSSSAARERNFQRGPSELCNVRNGYPPATEGTGNGMNPPKKA